MKRFALKSLSLMLCASCTCTTPEVQVRFPPAGVPLNEYFTLDVSTDPARAALVSVDADMPAHKHGMVSQPIVHALEPGHWRVDGMLFHMPGAWEVYVMVSACDTSFRLVFPVEVEP